MVYQDVKYVRFDTVGTAARKPQTVSFAKKAIQTKTHTKQKTRVICIDPVATLAIAVAGIMLVCMMIGLVQYFNIQSQNAQMQQYVAQLSEENSALRAEYEAGYDLETIEKTALALGMVPKDQAEVVEIVVDMPEQTTTTLSFWERIGVFLTGLFA